MALALAEHYGVDIEKASTAALLHDSAKQLSDDVMLELANQYGIEVDAVCEKAPNLLHGPVAAERVKRSLGIEDEEVLRAIKNHTTGTEGMCPLEKILYLADLIEESRDFAGVAELRQSAFQGLDRAVFLAIRSVLAYIIEKGKPIHMESIRAYNDLINKEQ
jgi:predicted HD superfamily hydrolase involved in NAD metabolism